MLIAATLVNPIAPPHAAHPFADLLGALAAGAGVETGAGAAGAA